MRLLGLALIGLGISSLASAQSQPDATALAGLWESKLPKRADTIHYKLEIDGETQTGDCQVDIDEKWIVFLSEANGNLEGTVTSTYFRLAKLNGFDSKCTTVAESILLANYKISLKPEGGKLVGMITLTNCVSGSCPKKAINVGLSEEEGKVTLSLEDKRKVELVRRERKTE
ncbi:MAG TPA: hypothetical protein VLM42_09000 [Bryobacteraceae bacterium]|nr:hypothetical protein [Bryobacteraceae bacterium]